jgi:Bacterial Ig-like domain (group 2)
MFDKSWLRPLAVMGLVASITSCGSTPSLTSIVISPSSFTTTLAFLADGTVAPPADQLPTNYKAIGYYTHPGHPAETRDITDSVTWFSFTPNLVTINSSGVATPAGLAVGFTQIWASAPGYEGDIVSNSSIYTVDLPSSTTGAEVVSISIQQPNPTVSSVNANESFKAIGITGNGDQMDLTSSCAWSSSNTSVATVNSKTGVATAVGAGTSSISATFKNSGGIEATGFTTLTVQ